MGSKKDGREPGKMSSSKSTSPKNAPARTALRSLDKKLKNPSPSQIISDLNPTPLTSKQNPDKVLDKGAEARRRWKKAGNLAIAVSRFERSAKEAKEKEKEKEKEKKGGSGSNTPSGGRTPVHKKPLPIGVQAKPRMTTIRVTPKASGGGGGFIPHAVAKAASVEEARCKAKQGVLRRKPGPRVENGRFSGRGVHKLRFSEKMRGVSVVTQHIVIGGRDEANNKELLEQFGITHVLNSCKQLQNFYPEDFTYCKINAMDSPMYDIRKDFQTATTFLARVEKLNGRVLVHCIAGVSRSVCFVLMHLMRHHDICLNQAYKHIKDIRPFVCPNEGFMYEMAMFEVETFGWTSVAGPKAGKMWKFYQWNAEKGNHQKGGDEGALLGGTRLDCVIL